jgi:hypothetical protein
MHHLQLFVHYQFLIFLIQLWNSVAPLYFNLLHHFTFLLILCFILKIIVIKFGLGLTWPQG